MTILPGGPLLRDAGGAGLDALVLQFGGGAPKGVFRYKSAAEANEAQERWTTERVQ